MKSEKLNRREVLVLGKNLLLTSMVMGLPMGCSISRSGGDGESRGEVEPVDGKGTATVKELAGKAATETGPVFAGDTVKSGAVITLASGGKLVLSLSDRSVLQLEDDTRLQLNLDSKEGGDLNLEYGSLLSVVTPRRRRRHYRIKGVTAQVDVKGTVCFLRVFKPGSDRPAVVPARVTDYFCICNGAIDYLNPAGNSKEMSLSAEHHKPYFLYPEGDRVGFIETDEMLNHNDREILSLINQMDGEKHDTLWLKEYGKNAY